MFKELDEIYEAAEEMDIHTLVPFQIRLAELLEDVSELTAKKLLED